MLVHTTKGLIEFDQLEVRDIVEVHENARVQAVEWFLSGELVRRDVFVNVLRSADIAPGQGNF